MTKYRVTRHLITACTVEAETKDDAFKTSPDAFRRVEEWISVKEI